MAGGLPSRRALLRLALRRGRRPDWRAAETVRLDASGVLLSDHHAQAFVRAAGGPWPPRTPLTFPYVVASRLHVATVLDPRFPLAPVGLVHVAERIQRWRTLAVGTRVDITCEASRFRETPAGIAFSLRTTLSQAGERVWESTTTAVRREGGGRPWTGEAPPPTEARWEVPSDMGRRYGWVAGNLDPIHVSALTARPHGFRRAVVHGMWTLARAVSWLGEPHGEASVTARFHKPLLLPATVRPAREARQDGIAFAVWPEGPGRPHVTGCLRTVAEVADPGA